ncbi:MAG TPA: hypothetical protein VD788_15545 [Candidatus Polarisedimenticolaceae bacterium]|nr:hypothetical protein [Candidatus Polarisedimenticolaceae bacterium]
MKGTAHLVGGCRCDKAEQRIEAPPSGKGVRCPSERARRASERWDSIVIPSVVPGAIVEWKYNRYFDNRLPLWIEGFEGDVPTLLRRIEFDKPHRFEYRIAFSDRHGRQHRPRRDGNTTRIGRFATDGPIVTTAE